MKAGRSIWEMGLTLASGTDQPRSWTPEVYIPPGKNADVRISVSADVRIFDPLKNIP